MLGIQTNKHIYSQIHTSRHFQAHTNTIKVTSSLFLKDDRNHYNHTHKKRNIYKPKYIHYYIPNQTPWNSLYKNFEQQYEPKQSLT